MVFASQIFGWAVGLTLELLIIARLLRGAYKQFPFVFAYTVANFLTTVIEISLYPGVYRRDKASIYWFMRSYWIDEAILQLLIFAVVISLIYYSTAHSRARRIVLLGLIPAAVLFAGVSFLIHYKPNIYSIGVWMTPWTRDLYVCSTVLDLGLWAILIAARRKNYRLLMLSGALGIQFTGEAIGGSVRNLATGSQNHAWALAGSIFIMLTNLTAMYVWWHAFRPAAGDGSRRPPAVPAQKTSEPPAAGRLSN
jgi:hypothetical protein